MSKSNDMLSSVVRAAVGVPQAHLELLAKMASKLSIGGKSDPRPEGEVWHAYLKKLTEQELPDWAYLLGVEPTVIELGEYVVNYDETAEQKLQKDTRNRPIYADFLFAFNRLSPGMFRPVERSGNVCYKASAVSFSKYIKKQAVEEWARKNNKIMAGLKEGADVALATPPIKLAHALPLVWLGERRHDHQDYSYVPSLHESNGRLVLGQARFEEIGQPTLWSTGYKFLVLEEIKS